MFMIGEKVKINPRPGSWMPSSDDNEWTGTVVKIRNVGKSLATPPVMVRLGADDKVYSFFESELRSPANIRML